MSDKYSFFIFFVVVGIILAGLWMYPSEVTYHNSEQVVMDTNYAADNNDTKEVDISNTEMSPLPETITEPVSDPSEGDVASSGPVQKWSFYDDFSQTRVVEESGQIYETKDSAWSLSSGAYFYIEDGIAKTIQGEIGPENKWTKLYRKENPGDTDDGIHPQNIFRLQYIGHKPKNYIQESWFKITKDNLSDSSYRNQSNGLLFFNRYIDSNNLYYTGLRVDGYADIKKKYKGQYYTFTHEKVIDGLQYDRDENVSLLPKDTWIGLKTEVRNVGDKSVEIKFYVDIGKTGKWKLATKYIDDGTKLGPPFLNAGLVGIRTDFMDVIFDDFSVKEL